MKSSVTIKRKNPDALKKILEQVKKQKPREVAIGVTGNRANAVDANGVTGVQKAAWNNFGADIDHPGGTPYRVVNGRAQFVKKGSPGADKFPVTKPHRIKIPARPFADNASVAILEKWRTMRDAAIRGATKQKKFIDVEALLNVAGAMGVTEWQRAIDNMTSPTNAPSTIKKKGSSHPLIDSGDMKQSVTFVVRDAGGGSL